MTDDKQNFSIPLSVLSMSYNILETELKHYLLRRDVKYQRLGEEDLVFYVNDLDLEYLTEISEFNFDMERYKETYLELINFLNECSCKVINKKPLLDNKRWEKYKAYIRDCDFAFSSVYREARYLDNYREWLNNAENKVKIKEEEIEKLKYEVEKAGYEVERLNKEIDGYSKVDSKTMEALTDLCAKYKQEIKELKSDKKSDDKQSKTFLGLKLF